MANRLLDAPWVYRQGGRFDANYSKLLMGYPVLANTSALLSSASRRTLTSPLDRTALNAASIRVLFDALWICRQRDRLTWFSSNATSLDSVNTSLPGETSQKPLQYHYFLALAHLRRSLHAPLLTSTEDRQPIGLRHGRDGRRYRQGL